MVEQVQNGQHSVPVSKLAKRINALRVLQLTTTSIEAKMFDEIFELEQKYTRELQKYHDKRKQIINGTHEPNSDEYQCDIPLPENFNEIVRMSSLISPTISAGDSDIMDVEKGIPDFWLNVMKNASAVNSLVQEHDEPLLGSLVDITVEYDEETYPDSQEKLRVFTLVFHFAPNKYMKNEKLTKKYKVRTSPSEDNPFAFEGPEIVGCEGCTIDWYPDHKLTERVVERQKKDKRTGVMCIVEKTLVCDSFFHFFTPPTEITDDVINCNASECEEIAELLEEHYEIGHFMREKMIPNAVLFYTGECPDMDSDIDDDDDDVDLDAEDDIQQKADSDNDHSDCDQSSSGDSDTYDSDQKKPISNGNNDQDIGSKKDNNDGSN